MDEAKQADEVRQNNNRKRKVMAAIVFTSVAVIGIIAIFFYLQYKNTHISTDDAFIDGHIHTIASKVSGTVKQVNVEINQYVKAGDLLVEIDPADYDVKVNEATAALNAEKAKLAERESAIESARRMLSELKARVESARANLELQEANLNQAESDLRRAEALFRKEAITKERYERQQTSYDVGAAQVKAAKEQLKQAEMAVEAQKAVVGQTEASRTAQSSTIKQREAAVEAAQLSYSYTKIFAPVEGYVTKKSVEKGNQIQPGQPIMAIVPLNEIYVTANYKETQLGKMKAGQRVEIKVDTYPGKTFKGQVESIMAGTGAVFSLFPAENATGNYVKVVQRIPVRIVFDRNADEGHVLRVGMSVEPTVILDK
jgi:membrane fusion protein (multidrug efflux system)